jgi:hypothetical protein
MGPITLEHWPPFPTLQNLHEVLLKGSSFQEVRGVGSHGVPRGGVGICLMVEYVISPHLRRQRVPCW